MNIFKHFGIKKDNKSKNLALSGTTQSLARLAVATTPTAVGISRPAQAIKPGIMLNPNIVPSKSLEALRKPSPLVPLPKVIPGRPFKPGWGGPTPGHGLPPTPSIPRAQPAMPKIVELRPQPKVTGMAIKASELVGDRLLDRQDAIGSRGFLESLRK